MVKIEDVEVVKVEWFPQENKITIGIVIIKDDNDENVYYMGVIHNLRNDLYNIQYIINHGTEVNYNRMRNIFK